MTETNNIVQNKDTSLSRKMQGKRSLANVEACKLELKNELIEMFESFHEAVDKVNGIKTQFIPGSASRGFEATIMQSAFAESMMKKFGHKAFYGKGKRFIYLVKDYVILFKKLNNKGMPMNIKTGHVQDIMNQMQQLNLFANTEYNDGPILYFGYKKNNVGEFVDPQLIYIDEGKIVFTISDDSNGLSKVVYSDNYKIDEPTVKENVKVKNKKIV